MKRNCSGIRIGWLLREKEPFPNGWSFDGAVVSYALFCEGREAPLVLRAEASAGDRAEVKLFPHRIELYVNGALADEEWPTAYAAPTEYGDCDAAECSTEGAEEPVVLGEFRNAEGWRPGGGVYVGDCMPYSHDGRYHVLYLKDRHRHQSKFGRGAHQWEHISTGDFVTWQIHPMAVPITEAWEGSICTGSWIMRGETQYLFYTVRTCDGGPAPLKRSVSADGYHFEKDESFGFVISEKYSRSSARDPKIILGADGKYHMFLTSTLLKAGKGCLVHLVSDDLDRWTDLDEPIYVAPDGNEPECSDYFELNGWHYLIFSHHGKGEYLYSDKPFTDWRRPEDGSIPCKSVPKMAVWNGRIIFTGFDGDGRYAGSLTFMEAAQNHDGTLRFFPMKAKEE